VSLPRPRVALVTYAMHFGGMEALLLRLGSYLRQQGCYVEIITTLEPGEWFGRVTELGMKASHVSGRSGAGVLTSLLHSRRVRSKLAGGRYDVVFLNHSRHAQACIGGLPDDMVVVPILHNDHEEIYRVGCANPDAWNVAVAVSPKVAETTGRRVPRRPVLLILSGVDRPDENLLAQRLPLEDPIRLIFVGRLDHAQKGVLWLPEILRGCLDRGLDATLTIVGDGPDADRLQQSLAARALDQRTRWVRGVPPKEVYRLLTQSHVLLMPSHFEGLPIALLESLACGCVPVVSRLPGITDVAVSHGDTGFLVETGNTAGFAEAVRSLASSPEQWARMSRTCQERAAESFSTEAMGSSYLRLIHDARAGHYSLSRSRRYQLPVDLSLFSWRESVPGPLRRLARRGRSWLASLSSVDGPAKQERGSHGV
jgi:glycosyltransferase involved in cell wall biosynthesis